MQRALLHKPCRAGTWAWASSAAAGARRGMGTALQGGRATRPAAGMWQARGQVEERPHLRVRSTCVRSSAAGALPLAGSRSYASGRGEEEASSQAASRLPELNGLSDPEEALQAALETVADAGEAATAVVAEVVERKWYMAPSYALESFLTGVHETTGLPWWASVVATGLLMRLALLPLGVYTVRNTAKMAELKPHIEAIKAKNSQRDITQMDAADKMKLRQESQAELAQLWKKAGVHPIRSFAVGLAQAPFFIYFFWTLRRMSETCEGFETGGALWFPDISIADPVYGLPCLTTLFFLANTELMRWLTVRSGAQLNRQHVIMGWFMRALAFILLPLTANFPAAVHLYWAASNASSAGQTLLWRSKKVRDFLDLPATAGLMSSATPEKAAPSQAAVSVATRAWKTKGKKKGPSK